MTELPKLRKTIFETIIVTVLLFLPLIIVDMTPPASAAGGSKTIEGVPDYKWRHGCCPTALGMVLGYYDTMVDGYPDLIPGPPGDAVQQTDFVNQSIASQSSAAKPGNYHYEDYCVPLDTPGSIQKDNSEILPEKDRHPDDCIADFLKTSRSALGLPYGKTWTSEIGPGFVDYVNSKNPSYAPYYREYRRADDTLTPNVLRSQIDNGRPMVFVIDSGTGDYDRTVTVIGYKEELGGELYYGCLDTSGTGIKWYSIITPSGKQGAVWGGWSLGLKPKKPIGNIPSSGGNLISYDAQTQEIRVVFDIQLKGLDLSGSYDVNGKKVTGQQIRDRWQLGIEGIWSNKFYIMDFNYKYTIWMKVNWISNYVGYGFVVNVQTGVGRSYTTAWYTDADKASDEQEGAVAAHEVGHYMGLYDEYDPALGAFVDPKNPIRDDGSIMGLCGEPRQRHYEHILKSLTMATGRTNMILAPSPPLPDPPREPIIGFSEPVGFPPFARVGGPYIAEEGYAMDFDAAGSFDLDGTIVSYSWDFGDGSTYSGSPTPTHTYEDSGVFTVTLTVTDDDGWSGMATASVTVVDTIPPSVVMVNPPSGYALQDGVTFIVAATDIGSGVNSVTFSIREDNGGDGIPVGFEDIPSIHEPATNNWKLWFNTQQLQDEYYVVVVKATDNAGNVGSITVPYSLRNWAVIELLPCTAKNKAGRTMPIKFSLRIAASVDPTQPFVYNEELIVRIFESGNPSTILQTSIYGNGAQDYRIARIQYITNFKTLPAPKQYTVSVNRNTFVIGSFYFQTVP